MEFYKQKYEESTKAISRNNDLEKENSLQKIQNEE